MRELPNNVTSHRDAADTGTWVCCLVTLKHGDEVAYRMFVPDVESGQPGETYVPHDTIDAVAEQVRTRTEEIMRRCDMTERKTLEEVELPRAEMPAGITLTEDSSRFGTWVECRVPHGTEEVGLRTFVPQSTMLAHHGALLLKAIGLRAAVDARIAEMNRSSTTDCR